MWASSPDCIIAGGGPVGGALALALAGGGLQVVLLEAREPAPRPEGAEDRALALSLASVRILEALGLWPAIAAEAEAIRRVHVSERGRFGKLRLDAAMLGERALGYCVGAGVLGAALQARLAACEGVQVLCPAALASVAAGPAAAECAVERAGRSERLRARLLVGADGGDSLVRSELGIDARSESYGQHAICANVTTDRPAAGTAYERFTPSGPVALLPMTGGRGALVLGVADEALEHCMALEDSAFLALANARTGRLPGRITAVGARHAYPLRLSRASARYAERAVLVGNAAHVIHPNAAQGLNLGLRDAAALAEVLLARARAGADIGAAEALAAYSAGRERDEAATVRFSDGLARVFYHERQPVAALRHIGLLALDLCPPARRYCLRLGTGLAGRPPAMALERRP